MLLGATGLWELLHRKHALPGAAIDLQEFGAPEDTSAQAEQRSHVMYQFRGSGASRSARRYAALSGTQDSMYHVHWRLNGTPFSGALDRGTPEVGAWYGSPAQEEALARLDFLYQQQRRLGLVLGDPGHGKSLLLRMFARRARRGGAMVALINLQGSGPEDLLWQTAITWGLNPARDETDAQLWRRLQEFLTQQSYLDVPTLLLLDDALDADPMPQGALLRLSQLAGDGASRLTMILSGIANRAGRLGGQLLELTDLRIELPAWRLVEVAEYLHAALERCGSRERIFADSAIQRLYDLTDGVPRQVNRLAELALVAGAADRLPEVDAKVVESVFHELARGV